MYRDKRVIAIIAAAGKSRRMGGIDKQYLRLGGDPVLAHSVRIFQNNKYVDEIVVVVRPGSENKFYTEITSIYDFDKVSSVISGGLKRPESIMKGMNEALKGADTENSGYGNYVLLIHDGARPFTEQSVVDAVIAGAAEYGAAVPCINLRDTVKTVYTDGAGREFALKTPDRSDFRAVQTPQGFSAEVLMNAYRPYTEGSITSTVTDDASLVEMRGGRVLMVRGSESNVKITVKSDIEMYDLRYV